MRSSIRKAIASFTCGAFFIAQLSGCGGSGSTSGTSSTPAPTVTMSANPTSITAGQSSTLTITTSAATTATGTGSLAGNTIPLNTTGTITVTPTTTSTYGVTVTGPGGNNSASVTVTVTPVPVTITKVTVTANPTAITMAQTSTCTAVVTGTGAFSSAVTWTATNGTIIAGSNNTATLTPSGVGTATCTANSAQTGYTTMSGSANVAVTRATPVINSATSLESSWIFCGISCNKAIVSFILDCPGCQAGDQINFSGYWPAITLTSANIGTDGKSVGFQETFGATQTPSFIYFTDVPVDGTPASNTKAFAYVGGANTAAHAANGQMLNQYNGTAYVWQKNADGSITSPLSFTVGGGGWNTVYETDGTNAYFINGYNTYSLTGTGLTSAASDGWAISSTAAENGTACVVEPGGNEITLYHPAANQNPQANRIPVGTMPFTCTMTTIAGTTNEYVASVNGTPTLWKFGTSGNSVGSAPLTGFTSQSDINAAGYVLGGWPMAAFHGTAAGKVASVSTYNQTLLVFDATNNSMPLLKTIPLPCAIPVAVDAIDATGKFVVACIKVAGFYDSGTTFLSVDPVAGTATPLAAFSKYFPNGFVATATDLFVFQGSVAPDDQPNQ